MMRGLWMAVVAMLVATAATLAYAQSGTMTPEQIKMMSNQMRAMSDHMKGGKMTPDQMKMMGEHMQMMADRMKEDRMSPEQMKAMTEDMKMMTEHMKMGGQMKGMK